MLVFNSKTEEDTFSFGKKLGKLLKRNDLVCLNGDLGTGKTVLVRGIAAGLGINEYITSPTFTIVNEYIGKINLYHFDVYRIDNIDDMYEIGFLDYLEEGICVIEWAENVEAIIPDEFIEINITKNKNDFSLREIKIAWAGEKHKSMEKLYLESGYCENEIVSD